MVITNNIFRFTLVLCLSLASSLVQATPEIQYWQSRHGAEVYYVHAPGLPIVDLQITFNAGSARDGDLSGLSSLTNHMLGMGAGGLDATQIAQRFEGVGAIFSHDVDRDMAWLKLRSLSQKKWLDPAVDTLSLVLEKPNFSKKDFDREKKRYLISLKGERQNPGAVASRAFYKAIYGNHPYGNMPNGTEKTINNISRNNLKNFFRKYYVVRNATIAIVGDLDKKAAASMVERLLEKVPSGKAAPPLPEVAELKEAKTIRLSFPSSQSHVLMGQPGNYRGDPDYFVMYLGNHALGGGGLVSRLGEEIREKRGLSYSVYSYFLPLARKGIFQAGMQTKNTQVDLGVKVLRETIRNFIDKGITEKELIASRKNITGGFPLRIDSNKKILGYLAMIGFYKLPLTYLNDFNKKIDAITLKQIRETLRRRLHVDRMVTVIVGGGQ
ncbi:MAG TPA: insulinase family protein [Gammaproteobacteria bacterium]|nr:insulinase family protein [Gammaproteobacteria bacterium]